jgi:hypothetical protein
MKNPKDKSGAGRLSSPPDEHPSERELSQHQALKNAEAARDTHRSHIPGVADDSEAIQGRVAALAAPIEGAADALREDKRARVRSQSPIERLTTSPDLVPPTLQMSPKTAGAERSRRRTLKMPNGTR